MKRTFLTAGTCSLLNGLAMAQLPFVDLTMVNNGLGQLEVRARPSDDFDGVISALTFTIRWDSIAGTALDTAVILWPAGDYMPVSGGQNVHFAGGYCYKVFTGFGMAPIAASGPTWIAGREYPLCTIDILAPGVTFELANDPWTFNNNTDYFVSLNGLVQTGAYFHSPEPDVDIRTHANGNGGVDVVLNPATDFFGTVTDIGFTLRWPAATGATLGAIAQAPYESAYLPLQKVGGEVDENGYRYQRFQGAGSQSLANTAVGLRWAGGLEHVILSVPLIGSANIEVVDDAWTNQYNSDYRIELNGIPHTGNTYGNITSTAAPNDAHELSLRTSVLGDQLQITCQDLPHGDLRLRLYDITGQQLVDRQFNTVSKEHSSSILLPPHTKGVLLLKVDCGEEHIVKRVPVL